MQILNSMVKQFPEVDEYKFVYSVPQIVDPDVITCIIEPGEEGGLYLGGFEAAKDLELLKKLKIRAVLTASVETAVQYNPMIVQFHEVIQAHDKGEYNIMTHADLAYDFIEKHRQHTNVLVHCFIGISRSVTLATMYIMRKYQLNLEKALWKIKSKRRQVNPNVGFMKQLVLFESQLKQSKNKGTTNFFKMVRQQGVPQHAMQPVSRVHVIQPKQLINPDVQLSRIKYQQPPQQFTNFLNEYQQRNTH